MARLNTFYLAPPSWREPFILDGEEAHHLIRVLRGKTGQDIRLMDGQGRSGIFRISGVDKKEVHLSRISDTQAPASPHPLALAVGWSKNARRGFLLEKAVELGAPAIWFWTAERSQGETPDRAKETWERQLVAAAKQCGALWFPEIRTLSGSSELIRESAEHASRILCWEQEETHLIHPDDLTHSGGTVAVLGPEGGLDENEAQLFQDHGFAPKSLGPSILRFETAALFLLSLRLWGSAQAFTAK